MKILDLQVERQGDIAEHSMAADGPHLDIGSEQDLNSKVLNTI